MFVKDHILKIKELSKSNVALQNSCNATLDLITKNLVGKENKRPFRDPLNLNLERKMLDNSKDAVEQEWDIVVDALLEPLQMACSSANPRLIENSLEAMLTLLEKNMIIGSLRSGKIVDLLAKCYEVKDDSVHMTILLTYGMFVAKPACELHDANLMTAIRISYNIFLITSNAGIQKMAKEKLTEIFRTLFQRMDPQLLSGSMPAAASASSTSSNTSSTSSNTANEESKNINNSINSNNNISINDTHSSPVSRPDTPSQIKSDDPENPNLSPDEATLNKQQFVGEDESVPSSGLSTPSILSATPSSSSLISPQSPSKLSPEDIGFRDCVQAFRGLCKLSIKPIPEANASNIHSLDVRSRILSLELLNTIFEEDNLVTFRNHSRFISLAIKKQLMDSIYCNIASPISLVFRMTISLCVVLIKEFREYLKAEVEALLGHVILPILESPNAPPQHRLAIIRSLYGICKSPQCIVDLFINYDCDLGNKDIFEQIAKSASRVSQKKLPENLPAEVLDQEALVRHLALKTSVCITIALVEWSKNLYEHPADAKTRREAALKAVIESTGSAPVVSIPEPSMPHQYTPDLIQQRKSLKLVMDKGRELFSQSFKKGIRYFWEQGMCEKNEAATALFLKNTPGLDKTMLGDFLGERDAVDGVSSQGIMKEYSQLFNYTGMEVDLALRVYLGCFRLPGEGQKVARIMESFAEKYYKDTLEGSTFGNSDAVYFLCMAITMLTTSLHNTAVQQADKLTKASWKKLLLGQNAERDYDDTMIDEIFARIAAEEFKVLGEEPPVVTTPTQQPNDRLKMQTFLQETKTFSDKAKDLVKEKYALAQEFVNQLKTKESSSASTTTSDTATGNNNVSLNTSNSGFGALELSMSGANLTYEQASLSAQSEHPLLFYHANLAQYADQMIKVAAEPLLSAYKTNMESTNDLKTVHMCLEGIRGGIRLTCLFDLKDERDAFISTLCSATLLEQFGQPKEIKAKNVDAILALLTVAEEEGNLRQCWIKLLGCISPLERVFSYTPVPASKTMPGNTDDDQAVTVEELNNAAVTSKIRAISIDRIFTNSSRLSDEAVVDFVSALCEVSKGELSFSSSSPQPRTFSLQKLVEVADFNINRPKSVWIQLWASLSKHFVEAGLHRSPHVSLVAVDSLRQVASKLLEKHTSPASNWVSPSSSFQTALLSPFEAMYTNQNSEIRDYLICCLAKLMATHHKCIEEGWASIFKVLVKASNDSQALVELGLHQLETIKTNYFQSLVQSNFFVPYVRTVTYYASNIALGDKIATQALSILKFAAQELASGKLQVPNDLLQAESSMAPSELENEDAQKLFVDRPSHQGQWFPILKGFTATLENHDINIRPIASNMLFETLNSYGHLFSKRLFKSIFCSILFPVFDKVLKPAMSQLVIEDTEWLLTPCHKFLHGTIVLFSNFFDEIGELLLNDTLELLTNLTLQNNEKLATFGITSLETLLSNTTSKYTHEMWGLVIKAVAKIMKENMPQNLKVQIPNQAGSSININTSATIANESQETETRANGDATQTTTQTAQTAQTTQAPGSPNAVPKSITRNRLSTGVTRSTSVRRADPRKKILLGKAWIQNLGLKTIKECIIDGNQPPEIFISKLAPAYVSQILDIYLDSFIFAYKILRDAKLEDQMEQALYDLILKQEIDSMWTYIEILFNLYNDQLTKKSNKASDASPEILELADSRILKAFGILEQCHMMMANQQVSLSERRKRLHESNEALVISFLGNIQSFADDQFLFFIKRMYPALVQITLSDSIKVRETIRDIMSRIGILSLGISKEQMSSPLALEIDLSEPIEAAVSPSPSPKHQSKPSHIAPPVELNQSSSQLESVPSNDQNGVQSPTTQNDENVNSVTPQNETTANSEEVKSSTVIAVVESENKMESSQNESNQVDDAVKETISDTKNEQEVAQEVVQEDVQEDVEKVQQQSGEEEVSEKQDEQKDGESSKTTETNETKETNETNETSETKETSETQVEEGDSSNNV